MKFEPRYEIENQQGNSPEFSSYHFYHNLTLKPEKNQLIRFFIGSLNLPWILLFSPSSLLYLHICCMNNPLVKFANISAHWIHSQEGISFPFGKLAATGGLFVFQRQEPESLPNLCTRARTRTYIHIYNLSETFGIWRQLHFDPGDDMNFGRPGILCY